MGKEQLRQFILEYLSPADYRGKLKTSRNYEKYRQENPNVRSVTGGRRGEVIPVTPRTKIPVMSSKKDVPSARKDRRSDAEIDRLSQTRQQRVDRVKKGRKSLADRVRNMFGVPNAPEARKTKLQRSGFTKPANTMGGTNPDEPNVGMNKPFGQMRPVSGRLGKKLYK